MKRKWIEYIDDESVTYIDASRIIALSIREDEDKSLLVSIICENRSTFNGYIPKNDEHEGCMKIFIRNWLIFDECSHSRLYLRSKKKLQSYFENSRVNESDKSIP